MEGACVYRNSYNNPTLIIYKEYSKDRVFLVVYYNNNLYKMVINCKTLTYILPRTCEHILIKLPIKENIDDTIKEWKRLVREKLIILNYIDSKNKIYDFKNRFKI